MCILAFAPGQQVEVTLYLESIYPVLDSTLDVCDLLITNRSIEPITSLCLLYPHPTVAIDRTGHFGKPDAHRFRQGTADLLQIGCRYDENWFYDCRLNSATDVNGILAVACRPDSPYPAFQLSGSVRKDHVIEPLGQLTPEDHRLLQELTQFSILECRLSQALPQDEATWIRMRLFPRVGGPLGPAPGGLMSLLHDHGRANYTCVGPAEVRSIFCEKVAKCLNQLNTEHLPDFLQFRRIGEVISTEGFCAPGTRSDYAVSIITVLPDRFLLEPELESLDGSGRIPQVFRGPYRATMGRRDVHYWDFVSEREVSQAELDCCFTELITTTSEMGIDPDPDDINQVKRLATCTGLDGELTRHLLEVAAKASQPEHQAMPAACSLSPEQMIAVRGLRLRSEGREVGQPSINIDFKVTWARRLHMLLRWLGVISLFGGGLVWRSPRLAMMLAAILIAAAPCGTKLFRWIAWREVRHPRQPRRRRR